MASPIRAVIVSIYGTILEKAEPAPDGESRWQELCVARLGAQSALSLADFNAAADAEVVRLNDDSARTGVLHPVAYWPTAARAVLPGLASLASDACDDFLYTHAQIRMPTRAVPGAVIALRKIHRAGVVLGLVSNGYPHTPVELALALDGTRGLASSFLPAGLQPGHVEKADAAADGIAIFERPLCFWAFAHGFGKPNPHVFRHLTRRLEVRGINADEILIVGDSETADLAPARAFGWQTWRIADESGGEREGNWFGVTAVLGLQ